LSAVFHQNEKTFKNPMLRISEAQDLDKHDFLPDLIRVYIQHTIFSGPTDFKNLIRKAA